MCNLWFKKQKKKKNTFTFGGWFYYAFTVTVSHVITRERWFRVYFFMLKTSRFRPNPTRCILLCGLNTIWGNFQTAASDSYFWKKRNDWVSYKTTTTNLNRNHMAYPTLFHAAGTQCFVAVFLPLVCFLWRGHSSLNRTMLQSPAAFLFE